VSERLSNVSFPPFLSSFSPILTIVLDKVPFAVAGAYVNDLSVDTKTGQRVYAEFPNDNDGNATVFIKFKEAGTYNMKAHCPSTNNACVRSNHVLTVVS
jgi:hypothetical protein